MKKYTLVFILFYFIFFRIVPFNYINIFFSFSLLFIFIFIMWLYSSILDSSIFVFFPYIYSNVYIILFKHYFSFVNFRLNSGNDSER
jgi:hypothetical protein